ncbi:MAG: hypothetical protein QOE90_1349 [Thermoplasmata archaeon]|jgi:hypothetical protein|nr:hypothetical protein [Thermoplasmata archaeon]
MRLRLVALALGAALIVLLMRLLPADVFAATETTLLVVASAVLLLVALSVVLRPARGLAQRLFALPLRVEGPLVGLPRQSEMPVVLRPLLVAGVCFVVAAAAAFLR